MTLLSLLIVGCSADPAGGPEAAEGKTGGNRPLPTGQATPLVSVSKIDSWCGSQAMVTVHVDACLPLKVYAGNWVFPLTGSGWVKTDVDFPVDPPSATVSVVDCNGVTLYNQSIAIEAYTLSAVDVGADLTACPGQCRRMSATYTGTSNIKEAVAEQCSTSWERRFDCVLGITPWELADSDPTTCFQWAQPGHCALKTSAAEYALTVTCPSAGGGCTVKDDLVVRQDGACAGPCEALYPYCCTERDQP